MRLATLGFAVVTCASSLAWSSRPSFAGPAATAPAPTAAAAPTASEDDSRGVVADDCGRARALGRTCVLTLGAEEVEGGVIRPDGDVIDPRLFVIYESLIRLRRDFIPEILDSANDVR